MRSKANPPTRPAIFIVAAMTTLLVFGSWQEPAASQSRQRLERERQKADIEQEARNKAALPQVEYSAPEPQDMALRQLRKARGKRYREATPFADLRTDITEISIGSHDLLDIPGLPIAQSDLVILGTVSSAKGYLTENKAAAYSEYTININEVFKGAAKLTGSSVIAERIGAKVIFPSGRAILVLDAYRGTPETGHRYVLFLKYSPEGEDYLIVTAYDLRNGRVMSIDRLPQCAFFNSNEETAFLDLVRSSVK